jgi:NAD+ diphosphatase
MPLPLPSLPEPAHPTVDSMLSRKFGKEVANYFSGIYTSPIRPSPLPQTSNTPHIGSPLNRVSFLRPDHAFLSQALKHPSTSFLLFSNLEPLTKSPTEIFHAQFTDLQPLIGSDPYHKNEEEVIAQYNSELYIPQIIFLGLDERKGKEGFVYKEHYKGQPYFAVDITPQKSVTKAAEELIKGYEEKGLSFAKGRNMTLPAIDGMSSACL